jgi:hypothetical protein
MGWDGENADLFIIHLWSGVYDYFDRFQGVGMSRHGTSGTDDLIILSSLAVFWPSLITSRI